MPVESTFWPDLSTYTRTPAAARVTLLALAALLVLAPLAGAWVAYGGLPPGWGFPAQKGLQKPGFDLRVLLVLCTPVAAFLALVAVPGRLGFRRAEPRAAPAPAPYPWWFSVGVATMAVGWFLMWVQPRALSAVTPYAFSPQWWGFILTLDGVVHRRTGGRSLLATRPGTMLSLAIGSAVTWWFYEYVNMFLLENWYYPATGYWTKAGYLTAYTVAYTTISPAVMEWTALLATFPGFVARYTDGPRLRAGKGFAWAAIALGIALAFAGSIWPNPLFFTIWLGPDFAFAGALALYGLWTPAKDVARGDWSKLVVPAVACMLNGVVWEGWNYFSVPSNPHFWQYDVPYVGVAKIFEMPALGFFGYAPFGVSVWITWLAWCAIFRQDPAMSADVQRLEASSLQAA